MSNKARTSAELTELRAQAVNRAKEDPRNARAVELRVAIVKLREAGVTLPLEGGVPNEAQVELAKLMDERDALLREIWAEADALSAERGRVVRVEREIAAAEMSDKFSKLTDKELEKELRDATARQRAARAQKRALRVVIDERARQKAAREMASKMSREERDEMMRQIQALNDAE